MRKHAIALLVLLLYATTVAAFNWRGRPTHTPDFEQGANAALDMTLLVGNDATRKHEHLNWTEIDRRVAKRLKIKRNEWWLGGEQ